MAKNWQFDTIKQYAAEKKFDPIYLLHGEEEYFIDKLAEIIGENAIAKEEQDFNQTVFYGTDSKAANIIGACKRYPVMAERQLVVLREAQNMKDIEELAPYAAKPMKSTVLLICYKYGKLDGRKKLAQEIAKHGVIFESKKLYDNQVVPFIVSYLRKQNVKIEPKAAQLAFDSIGATITRFIKELEKIIATLPENNRTITTKQIEQNIGISRNFNNFELIKAIAKRDPAKAYQIAKYFSENPKNNTLVLTLSVLFSYFANLMICHYEKDKSRNAIKQALGLRSDIQIDDYSDGLENYTATKTMNIISLIRSTDAQSKGVGNPSLQNATLLKELLYKIMH